jgi:uncharacterized membrane protein (GlpM family)
MLSILFLFKIIVTVSIVLGLSLIAEHVSPRIAGLLAGYPLGAALALLFYGIEISPEFAAQSAIYTIFGLIAIQSFAYFYFIISSFTEKFTIPISSTVAVAGFFVIAWLLHFLQVGTFFTVMLTIASIFLFMYQFRKIKNKKIQKKISMSFQIIFVRAVFAALFIVVITGIAKLVGPRWAGLFSAFPTTFFPLLVIVHFTYTTEHAHTIIKNFPIGLGSIIAYALAVSFTYPAYGIFAGTAISLGIATLYLLIYNFLVYKGD